MSQHSWKQEISSRGKSSACHNKTPNLEWLGAMLPSKQRVLGKCVVVACGFSQKSQWHSNICVWGCSCSAVAVDA